MCVSMLKPRKIAFEIAATIKEKKSSLYLPLQIPLIIPSVQTEGGNGKNG